MKKVMAVILVILMLMSSGFAASAQDKKLTFNSDGTFRVLQINDFQDSDQTNPHSLEFLNNVLDKYEPDLVVLVGDQLNEAIMGPTEKKLKKAIDNQLTPIQERGIPFLFTFGNHDNDYKNYFPMEDQAAFYREFSCCYANADGFDGGTYNTVIYSSDGSTPKFNIYMMNTHETCRTDRTNFTPEEAEFYHDVIANYSNENRWYRGVTPDQVEWYKERSNQLKELNGGEPLPSFLFQHVPVKEISMLFQKVSQETEGAVENEYSLGDYYVLDKNAEWTGDRNVMRQHSRHEHPAVETGQYEAWVEQGDILGAYFGHDHINTFLGKTVDGIEIGHNGGFGFAAYGDPPEVFGEPGERYARIFDLNENDIENYTHQTIYFTEFDDEEEKPAESKTPEGPKTSEAPEKTEAPDEPQETELPDDQADDCRHLCHESGFKGFLWKIVRFFSKLFKTNPVCECGAAHY